MSSIDIFPAFHIHTEASLLFIHGRSLLFLTWYQQLFSSASDRFHQWRSTIRPLASMIHCICILRILILLALVLDPLIGTENYGVWSRAMLIALRAKNKIGFITGSSRKPAENHPTLGLPHAIQI